MQSDKHSATHDKEKQVVETKVKPAFPLISNQPERFGALSEAFLFIEERRLEDLLKQAKHKAILAAICLSIPIVIHIACRTYFGEPFAGTMMDITKILFFYLFFGAWLALIAIWWYRHKIFAILTQLEDLAYFGDDMARFYMPYARSELKDLNEKMHKHTEHADLPSNFEMLRDVWPIVQLLLKRDPNIIKWGSVGFKVYKTLSAFFKGPSNSESK